MSVENVDVKPCGCHVVDEIEPADGATKVRTTFMFCAKCRENTRGVILNRTIGFKAPPPPTPAERMSAITAKCAFVCAALACAALNVDASLRNVAYVAAMGAMGAWVGWVIGRK